MRYIELDNTIPNQAFNITTDNGLLEVELRTVDKITLMSVKASGNNIVNSIKVAPNVPIMCYRHLQEQFGDFIFTTVDEEYPYYINFNNANKLYLLSYDEVKEFNATK